MEWRSEAVATLMKLARSADLSAGDSERYAQMLEADRHYDDPQRGAAWWRGRAAQQRCEADSLRECAELLQR